MHLPISEERLSVAKSKGLPFFYSACDDAVPIAQLTTDISLVTCPTCRATAPVPNPDPARETSLGNNLGLEAEPQPGMDFDDLDEDLDALEISDDEIDSPQEEPGPDPMAAFRPMLEMVLAGYDPNYQHFDRWAMSAESDDEILGDHGIDIRTLLKEDELEFITTLIGVSKMAGIESLTTRVLAILHRILNDASIDQKQAEVLTDTSEK